jgi:catechol 2,3-dioxygenase-like lactoylglutathione lyase family enzyme
MDDECYGPGIEAAEVVLPCADLEPTLAFFTGRLGFRIASIFPAEAPRVAVVSGHGLRLRLDPRATESRDRCGFCVAIPQGRHASTARALTQSA